MQIELLAVSTLGTPSLSFEGGEAPSVVQIELQTSELLKLYDLHWLVQCRVRVHEYVSEKKMILALTFKHISVPFMTI